MLLIASSNPHKIAKLRGIIGNLQETITLADAHIPDNFKEEGKTLTEIAERKAAFYSRIFNGLAIATDGGVEIPALETWNPVLTKRFGGESLTDFERMELLLKKARRLKGEQRAIYWKESVSIADKGNVVLSFNTLGDKGLLQTSYDPNKYKVGIWVCSLWYYPKFGKNFFYLTPEELENSETSWKKIGTIIKKFLRREK